MAECNSVDHGFHETADMYPNLSATPLNPVLLSDQQQIRLNKIMKLNIIFLLKLKKEN